jgi:hypothetical protein
MMTNDWTAGSFRCRATDPDGYPCILMPSHRSDHRWWRCEAADAEGYRCILPPHHPGDHELAWYARPTASGATRTIRYRSRSERMPARATWDARVLASHDWFPASQEFVPWSWGLEGRLPFLAHVPRPQGHLVVVYEYRPDSSRSAGQGMAPQAR